MAVSLKLALLVAIVGCGCRAQAQLQDANNESNENDSVLTKLIKLEHRITESLTDVKAKVHELQYKAFEIEDLQKARIGINQSVPENLKKCPCGSAPTSVIKSCKDLKGKPSGRYMITVAGISMEVYCEQDIDGGGWIVIQNRYDGSESFNRDWSTYKHGFGDLNKEFWLGLEKIHMLTSSRTHELMLRMTTFGGSTYDSKYSNFAISGEGSSYTLTTATYASGISAMQHYLNKKFSTNDRDNDNYSYYHCAQYAQSGWWHRCDNFLYCNLNGGRRQNVYDTSYTSPSMTCYYAAYYYGLASSKMMIREV